MGRVTYLIAKTDKRSIVKNQILTVVLFRAASSVREHNVGFSHCFISSDAIQADEDLFSAELLSR